METTTGARPRFPLLQIALVALPGAVALGSLVQSIGAAQRDAPGRAALWALCVLAAAPLAVRAARDARSGRAAALGAAGAAAGVVLIEVVVRLVAAAS